MSQLRRAKDHHAPVLVDDVVQILDPQPNQTLIDCTFGAGGHSRALLNKEPRVKLVAIDRDPGVAYFVERLRSDFPETEIVFLQKPFSEALTEISARFVKANGLVVDLGISSMQIDTASRGFSYRSDGPLDLRMSPDDGEPAAAWLSRQTEKSLTETLKEFGEEPLAYQIAKAIVAHQETHGQITTTKQLADLVESVYKKRYKKPSRTPAPAKTFQALRMAVNEELNQLEQLLNTLPAALEKGGRAVAISFHSLEDRRVKHFFQRESKDCICPPKLPVCQCTHQARFKILKPFPIKPSSKEVKANPRAHSALLRAVERLP